MLNSIGGKPAWEFAGGSIGNIGSQDIICCFGEALDRRSIMTYHEYQVGNKIIYGWLGLGSFCKDAES